MSLTSYRAAPPRVKSCFQRARDVASGPPEGKCAADDNSSYCHGGSHRIVMHGFLEANMGEKPALQPKTAIGPVVRAIAANILAEARAAMSDPERSGQEAVHYFRRSMKEWRALMRLLAPFIAEADRWREEARDHARG